MSNPTQDPIVTAYQLYDDGKFEESAKIFEENGFPNMAEVIREEIPDTTDEQPTEP